MSSSLMLDLLLHWRIQRNGLCICDLDAYEHEDPIRVRRWCVDDTAAANEDHSGHKHDDPWRDE